MPSSFLATFLLKSYFGCLCESQGYAGIRKHIKTRLDVVNIERSCKRKCGRGRL